MAEAQIAAVLHDWTYPGALDTTSTLSLPNDLKTAIDPRPKYIRRFVIAASPAKVRRFYALKADEFPVGKSGYTVGYLPDDIQSYEHELQYATRIPSPSRKEDASFSHNANDYFVEAMISSEVSRRSSQVILLLIPYQPVIPSTSRHRFPL